MLDGKEVAFIGEVDPRLVRAFDVRFPIYIGSAYLERLPDRTTRQFTPPSRFPSTYRDLALILDPGVAAVAVERTVASATAPLCKRVVVFDEYRGPQVGEHKKSLAVRVVLQRDDATITDQEADAAVEKALAALESELGATLRA
jgi:phenylalanyl-tRNA synthetase beta chain